jgi:predicted NBD/HSP70 family sugar kinase
MSVIAAGIDLGGTKAEAQLFAPDWSVVERRRVDTPTDYAALVAAMAGLIAWARAERSGLPVGLCSAGLVNPATGRALTANLPATGRPFPADLAAACGGPLAYLNDCRAFTLSEARFGAGRGASRVAGLVLGTGVAGGFALGGRLSEGPAGLGGEFGHLPAPAHLVARHGLPLKECGCGRTGCIETFASGPGMRRISEALTGTARSSQEIAAARGTDPEAARVWAAWLDFVAELVVALSFTLDPDLVVLGGGLGTVAGLAEELDAAVERASFAGFSRPALAPAEGGDASGARGAAWAAWQEVRDG